jgi:signal transduction histidine kinase
MQPFEQVAGSLSREHDGAGLGLSLVHQFVSLHGGTFALESELGHGTRANVILPASRILSDKIVPLHPKTNGATR